MKTRTVCLSFDFEECDLPREQGVDFPIEKGMAVSVEGANAVLDLLDRQGVKATFFCTLNFAARAPEVMARIKAAGHEIAAHGVDHWKQTAADPKASKEGIEKLTGVKIVGYRQPRMFPVSDADLKAEGYLYNSSLNPAFIPGRYMHLTTPRRPFSKDGLLQIPASVTPIIRFPLFWLALHLLPEGLYHALVWRTLAHDGHFVTYFHPWEFSAALLVPELKTPGLIRRNLGPSMLGRLERLVLFLKRHDAAFSTMRDFAAQLPRKARSALAALAAVAAMTGSAFAAAERQPAKVGDDASRFAVPKWGAFKTTDARPAAPRPADFDAYWDGEVARFAKAIPLRPEIRLRTDLTNAVADIHEVSFAMNADGSRRLYGWLAFPRGSCKTCGRDCPNRVADGGRHPLYVEVPGAGYGCWTTDPAYSAEEIQLKLTVYDFRPTPYSGQTRKADFDAFVKRWTDRYGTPTYANAGWGASREEVFFHDVWLTMNRAVDWVTETYAARIDPKRVSYTGESQGGGSGFFLLAMNRRFTHGVLRVPAITDVLGRLAGRKSGWPQPYENQPTAEAKARVLGIAPYFDAENFAPRIRVPVRVCLGTADDTCPWPNVSAAFNALGSTDKELLVGVGDNHWSNASGQREKMERWRRESR